MADDEVKAKCCKVCNGVLASNRKSCIHCGACDPIKKDEALFWPWVLVFVVIALLLLGDQFGG